MTIILFIIFQHSTLNIHDETESITASLIILDLLFALEMYHKFVYNLLYKRINGKFSKASEHASIIEALATGVLNALKDAIEELYSINLLIFSILQKG